MWSFVEFGVVEQKSSVGVGRDVGRVERVFAKVIFIKTADKFASVRIDDERIPAFADRGGLDYRSAVGEPEEYLEQEIVGDDGHEFSGGW